MDAESLSGIVGSNGKGGRLVVKRSDRKWGEVMRVRV